MKAMKLSVALILLVGVVNADEFISPIPDSITTNSAKVALGQKLFFDPLLSKDGTISCASCHDLDRGGDDDMEVSSGIMGREGNINAPTVYNSVFNFRQFWDGRAKDLKEQARGPIENPIEMGHTLKGAVLALQNNKDYSEEFISIYPDGLTEDNIVDAIAEFEKTLITPNSPFDRYLKGDKGAISKEAKKGYELFISKGCIICHHGVNIGGNMYSKFGIFQDANSSSIGRYNVTKREEDRYIFKVPTLRNIAQTAPYMHDGRAKSLRDAVVLMSKYQLGRKIEPEEIDMIVVFLESLSGSLPTIKR